MDRGAWRATVHGVAKSRTRLSKFTSLTIHGDMCSVEMNGHRNSGFDSVFLLIWAASLAQQVLYTSIGSEFCPHQRV